MAQINALQPGSCKNSAVPVICFYLLKAGIHISADIYELVMWIAISPLRAAAIAAGGNGCLIIGIIQKVSSIRGNQRVARVGPFHNGRHLQRKGIFSGQIFKRMYGNIDFAVDLSTVECFSKYTLAAHFPKRSCQIQITVGLYENKLGIVSKIP